MGACKKAWSQLHWTTYCRGYRYSESSSIKSNFSLATPGIINNSLPCRPPDAHKGTFGRALIVAGSANYTGAAILAAQGALRSGAGLVTLAIPSSLHRAVVSAIPEATYLAPATHVGRCE